MSAAITSNTVWVDDNGQILCTDHAGSYLRCGIQAAPRAWEHHTPLGTWTRLSRAEVVEFEMHFGRNACETCR